MAGRVLLFLTAPLFRIESRGAVAERKFDFLTPLSHKARRGMTSIPAFLGLAGRFRSPDPTGRISPLWFPYSIIKNYAFLRGGAPGIDPPRDGLCVA